jgi:hypothetical protein
VSAVPVALGNLTTPLTLYGNAAQLDTAAVFTPPTFTQREGEVAITYDPAAKSYTFRATSTADFGSAVKLDRTLTDAQRNAAASNATFTAYQAANLSRADLQHRRGQSGDRAELHQLRRHHGERDAERQPDHRAALRPVRCADPQLPDAAHRHRRPIRAWSTARAATAACSRARGWPATASSASTSAPMSRAWR